MQIYTLKRHDLMRICIPYLMLVACESSPSSDPTSVSNDDVESWMIDSSMMNQNTDLSIHAHTMNEHTQTLDHSMHTLDALMNNPSSGDLSLNPPSTYDAFSSQDMFMDEHDVVDAFQLDLPPAPNDVPQFCFPILTSDRYLILEAPIIGMDHDPQEQAQATECTSHHGLSFPHCYDQHDGSDFLLAGGFDTMDQGSAMVVAAADGIVIARSDGHYDRCHASLGTLDVSCDGYPMRSNFVKIEHGNGWQTWYFHLKKESVLVEIGDRVQAGTPLGLVGSSGYSALPHLHFEVQDSMGVSWDPFAGPYSQAFSLWIAEGRHLPVVACP